ncbi:MAG: single-stranded DNA-binding protein [Spirochaetia bacterium]|nr:single-stranded DNA-binding protein [Spirochaetia bacterium]
MSDYNRIGLVGRLTKDVELKWTSAKKAYIDCSLAVHHWSKKTDDTDKKKDDDVSFFEIRAWAHTAEFIAKNCGKGTRLLVDGYLRQHRWEGRDGEKRMRVVVYCQSVQVLSSASGKESGGAVNGGKTGGQKNQEQEEEMPWEDPFGAGAEIQI